LGFKGQYVDGANSDTTIHMLIRHGRYVACAAAVVLALGGAGAALARRDPPGKAPAQTTAKLCGLVACSALSSGRDSTPTPDGGVPSTALGPGGAQTTRSPSPSPSAPAATPSPRPVRPRRPRPKVSPTPSLPDVTVAFSTAQRWRGGFQGRLTIDNQGSTAVNGWQLAITLPGDQVRFVWNADWHFGDGSLTLTPASNDQVIEPGASVSVNFFALGETTEPASCTLDGSACR
jgi:Cellulose binding domain